MFEPSAAKESQGDISVTSGGASTALNSFYRQLKSDTGAYMARVQEAGGAESDNSAKIKIMEEEYKKTFSYIDRGAVSDDKVKEIIRVSAPIFALDPNATATSDADDFELNGNIATMDTDGLKIGVIGLKLPEGKSEKSHKITLTHSNGYWRITGYDPA
jgi:hypothetical protein